MEIFLTNARKNLKGNGRYEDLDFNNKMAMKKKEKINEYCLSFRSRN